MNVRILDVRTERFIDSLDDIAAGKVTRIIKLLEMFGHQLSWPYSRKVYARLFELRVHGRQEIRIFYTFHKDEAVLLHGFIKKSERIPNDELHTALRKFKYLI